MPHHCTYIKQVLNLSKLSKLKSKGSCISLSLNKVDIKCRTQMTIFNVQRAITQKVSKPDLHFSFSADSCKVYKYITETVNFNGQRPIIQKAIKQDLWFLCSTCHLMLLYIFARLQENLWNHFQIIERAQVYDYHHYLQCPKGSNSKAGNSEL